MQGHKQRNATSSEISVDRRLAHVPNAFTGAVAAMADPVPARELARDALRLATHCEEAAIRSFLASPYGGAFGVDVAQRVAAGDGLAEAIAVVVREWMARLPSETEAAAFGIAGTAPYLTAVVTAAGAAQSRDGAPGEPGTRAAR